MGKSFVKTLSACLMLVSFACASAAKEKGDRHDVLIEAYLDSIPGICSSRLDFNDFFAKSYIIAKVYANSDSIPVRIKVKGRRMVPSGNCDHYSATTAERLLEESSKSIIKSRKWKPGRNRCKVIWKPRHNHTVERHRHEHSGLMPYIAGLVTDETKRKLHKNDGSTFMRLKTDSTGTVLSATPIGSIFWETHGTGSISGLSVSAQLGQGYSTIFQPGVQPARYMGIWESRMYKADRQLRRNAREIARSLSGRQFSELAGKEREICIEIHIDTSGIEIEESTPSYPGGAKALKEYYTSNFRYGRILDRNNIKGVAEIGLIVKKSGKARLLYIELHEQGFIYEGKNSWTRISGEISEEIRRITRKMPRWTPGRYDGKKIESKCSFRIRLDASN